MVSSCIRCKEAFIEHDGFQCGYCTPGQLMSGISCIREGHAEMLTMSANT